MNRHDQPRPLPFPSRLALVACAFLATVLLGALAAMPAPAAKPPHAFAPAIAAGEEEIDEGETEEPEEEFEAEGDGGWLELEDGNGEEEAAPASVLPPECLLRAARPRAVLDSAHERLRLALAFKAWNATELDASFSLKGSRGALSLKAATRHPSRAGTLRLTRGLDAQALKKAEAAHEVVVRVDVPATPRYCHLTLRLPPARR
ncbi:MAG TPA: hypothetical protein VF245_11740 [Solirubrobacterales bacterium]